ncbi:hypothetical protein B0181_10690 [Moraxella caviae]|uniref:Uncharacterized protein n=1 Tax=Moraxella caviae TaxID=34060 RepID=A0A1S9ZUS0_9GAMM|nr:hypothetical protein B0181_10690 [Moraxella caviae]
MLRIIAGFYHSSSIFIKNFAFFTDFIKICQNFLSVITKNLHCTFIVFAYFTLQTSPYYATLHLFFN